MLASLQSKAWPRRGCLLVALPVALLATLALARPAVGQERPWNPYGTEVYREGPGVKLGNSALVVHPGLSVEGGYDSNVFYQSANARGSALLRLRLHVDLAPASIDRAYGGTTTADPKIDFRLSAQLEYREYLTEDAIIRQQRAVLFFLSGYVTLFPKGKISLRLDEDLIRTVDARNAEGPAHFARVYNRAGLTLTGKPGSGRLELGISEHFIVNRFDDDDMRFADSIQNDARLFARFKLLQRTLLTVHARVGYTRYQGNSTLETVPVRAGAEISSPISSWLEGTLALGYGGSIALRGTRLHTAISQEEIRLLLPLGIRITVGHRRDFADSLFANYYVDDAIYLGYQQPFLKRVRAFAGAQLRFRKYGGLVDPNTLAYTGYSTPGRDDILVDAHAGLYVQCLRWMAVAAVYNLLMDRTDFAFLYADGSSQRVDYIKHSAFAQLDFAY